MGRIRNNNVKMIGFLPMKRCNLRCTHCQLWAGCGPKSTDKNWDQVISKHLVAASRLGYDWVGFSGGELTLEMDKLLEAIKIAHELGAITSLVTNAWWGENPTLAGDMCNNLKLAGLDILKISYDSFHFEFLSRKTVKRAIAIAETFNFDLRIYAIRDDTLSVDDEQMLEGNIQYQSVPLYDSLEHSFHCKFKMMPIVSWDNCVYASCEGIPVGRTSRYYLGDLNVNTLEEILGGIG